MHHSVGCSPTWCRTRRHKESGMAQRGSWLDRGTRQPLDWLGLRWHHPEPGVVAVAARGALASNISAKS